MAVARRASAPTHPAAEGRWCVVIDAHDPWRLGEFYLALLGGELTADEDGEARLRPAAGGPPIDLVRVDDPRLGKTPVHLDVVARDLDALVGAALAAGATRADDVYDGGEWQVLRDPEGHELCVLRPGGADGPTP